MPNFYKIAIKNFFIPAQIPFSFTSVFAFIFPPLLKIKRIGTFLVAQWLRIHLPMQGTWVQSLVLEDPTCHGATKPVRHNY